MNPWRHGPKALVGLVGGIGAGKSTAARLLAARGAAVVDADALGHDALEQPDIRRSVLDLWGNEASLLRPDGRIDRKALGRLVFQNSAHRHALERVVFPYIRMRAFSAVAAAQADPAARFVVLDAAVMLEAGWAGVCDRVLYVDAPDAARRARVFARSGWTAADLAAREAAQWPAERKKQAADAVVLNDGDPARLDAQLVRVLGEWGIPAG